MMSTKRRYLIETSAVRAAIAETTPKHSRHFQQVTDGGEFSTSLFIRMEFLRRWICYYLVIALKVDLFNDFRDALNYESESFSQRDLKALIHLVSALNGKAVKAREAVQEIVHVAVTTLYKFDRRFRSRIANTCGCRIGGREFRPDFSRLLEDVRDFLKSCQAHDGCGIEAFLRLEKPSRASKLLDLDEVSNGTTAGKHLTKLKRSGQAITCKECQKIGDIVIALEQQAAWCLVHIDSAFDVLCSATKRAHLRVKSVKAIEGALPGDPL